MKIRNGGDFWQARMRRIALHMVLNVNFHIKYYVFKLEKIKWSFEPVLPYFPRKYGDDFNGTRLEIMNMLDLAKIDKLACEMCERF